MKLRKALIALTASALVAVGLAAAAAAHDSPNEGHVPANTNYGFEVVGRDTLDGVTDELYTDVWSHNGFAYVGTFQEPACSDAGVFIVDIDAAIANHPNTDGATVAHIRSAPNTRINDVKVHAVGDTDVLITTQEPCGMDIPGWTPSGGGAPFQVGQGGISLYDVTDPTKPKALKKNYLEFEGVHNTYAWDHDGKSYLIGTADTFDFFDTFFVDITRPQSPRLLSITGALDWFAAGAFDDGQFETGTFGGIFNHDVWVDIVDGTPTAVVSYWDAGFITLDVTDPANPVYLDDSTYPDPDPLTGKPYEGNAHAAVFGGGGDYIFGGDEDFDPTAFLLQYGGVDYPASPAGFGPGGTGLGGEIVWTGGEGCTPGEIPAAGSSGQVALVQRGSCFFQDKAESAFAQGYGGYIVANTAGDESLISMSPRDNGPYPPIPGVFVGNTTGEILKAGGAVSATDVWNGWGYLHIINNTGGDVTVPVGGQASGNTATIPQMGELGYYAPAETVEDPRSGGIGLFEQGDLTMHNIEADPLTDALTPTFDQGPRMFVSWYSLGMRALEYRPGHYHANLNDEGSYSQNVHEVGRFIADDGSNFWGIHIDETVIDGEPAQIILASDRNTGLWIFTFSCETRSEIPGNPGSVFYCDPATTTP